MPLNQSNVTSPFSLAGETALITGGGTGLGFGIAQAFVASGAKVALVGRRQQVLEEAAHRLGSSAVWETHDITRHDSAGDLVRRVSDRIGRVSILVNNAGIHIKKPAVEIEPNEFNDVVQTNLTAAFCLTRAVLPSMMQQGHGNVLFIASMASLIGLPEVAAYSAAKAAHLGLVRALAVEASGRGVRINAIAPGWIESDMLRTTMNGDTYRSEKVLSRTPMGRFGTAEEIGWAAVYLSSPAARFVTGAVLPVDGGASIGF